MKQVRGLARGQQDYRVLIAEDRRENWLLLQRLLESAGLRVLEREDRTRSVVRDASGRIRAMEAHRAELDRVIGPDEYRRQLEYLETAMTLAERADLSRMMYLAALSPAPGPE